MDEPKFTGCVVPARLIRPNDHRIAVAAQSKDDSDLKRIDDLNQNMLKEIERFFIAHNQERGKKFFVRGMRGPNGVLKPVKRSML